MHLRPFHELFPDLASREYRSIVLPDGGDEIPPGGYLYLECYCTDPGCDCRRVLLFVMNGAHELVASIGFGFDPGSPFSDPLLDPLNTQSEYAWELLELAHEYLFSDDLYVQRLERHYEMFKSAVQGKLVTNLDPRGPEEVEARIATRRAKQRRLRKMQLNKKRPTLRH